MQLMNFVKVFQLDRGGQILFYIEPDHDHKAEWAKINQVVQFDKHPASIGVVRAIVSGPWDKMMDAFDKIDKHIAEKVAEAIIDDLGADLVPVNLNGLEEHT